MFDKTSYEILKALFMRRPGQQGAEDPRIEVLVSMVFDLSVEVEALRRVVLASDLGQGGKSSVYGQVYEEVAYLTHNAAGPTSGWEKLLGMFYPEEAEGKQEAWHERPPTWRECLMLRRLGFTEEEIAAYKAEAEEAEQYT